MWIPSEIELLIGQVLLIVVLNKEQTFFLARQWHLRVQPLHFPQNRVNSSLL